MSSRYDVVVIGAGHNGLTAATYLAKAGKRVVVVERREQIGGLASGEEFHPGYRSAGVLHDTTGVRKWVVDELQLGKHGLELRKPPPAFVPQLQGPGYLHWPEVKPARKELSEISSTDAARYADYRAFIKRVTPVFRKVFDDLPPETQDLSVADLWNLAKKAVSLRLLGKTDMMEIFRTVPMCVADWVREWFSSEIVCTAVAAPAIHNTLTGPWSPGSNLNLLRAEVQTGSAVVGGPAALVAALAKAARSRGVEIRIGEAVSHLKVDSGRIEGVGLASGETLIADKVAASCDPKHLFLDLLPSQQLSLQFEQNLLNFRTRGTTAKVNLALDTYPLFTCRPELKAEIVRTGETLDDLERAFDPAKYRMFSVQPILDISVPTLENPELAPDGHQVFSILAHFAPYELEGGWSPERKEELLEAVLSSLARYAPGVAQAMVGHEILDPTDLESRYGVTGGQLHHGEHSIDQLLVRPTPECPGYRTPFAGLHLCGGGSHPGGGITCAPGALAARAILED